MPFSPEKRIEFAIKARAMMLGYIAAYGDENLEMVHHELPFKGEIVNPETGATSRTFALCGIIDGIVRHPDDGGLYIMEHKTASSISGDYVERLWCDDQIALYSHYASVLLDEPINGVLYNVLEKKNLSMKTGESEEDFEIRKAGMKCPSRAKRKMPESEEEYFDRLMQHHSQPTAYHRETLFLSRSRILEIQAELWDLTQSILQSRNRDLYYMNTDFCFQWNRPCEFWPLCSSQDPSLIIENSYEQREAHAELQEVDPDWWAQAQAEEAKKNRTIVTYSALKTFRNCRRKYQWKYDKNLRKTRSDIDALFFGSLIHECLEIWHTRRNADEVMLHIDSVVGAQPEPEEPVF